ncbi:glucose 1-dehydrogenase [Baekduia soli]|uniref:Glucose 1-dehydrogenase n=1 Tax=Baekduia soli TaxID=496014 RepID=A0A5B8UCF2_9ACTN|nr:glucose 1-dehydrogenase [Baekduia soli]
MQDKVCVVTGAAQGIGRETALEMARRGAKVVVSDVKDAEGQGTVDLVAGEGGSGVYVRCDVRSEDDIVALMAAAADHFGGIDVLHNNAGVQEADFGTESAVDTLPNEVWDAVYEINLRAVWLATKHAAPFLRRSTRGPAIVNASSTGGLTGYPGCPAYNATKGAVIQLTKATAIDLAPTIRCNCYCPAAVDTPMVQKYFAMAPDEDALRAALIGSHLVPRLGEPSDIASLVCFLASDEASFINGAAITIDGGSLAWRGSNG